MAVIGASDRAMTGAARNRHRLARAGQHQSSSSRGDEADSIPPRQRRVSKGEYANRRPEAGAHRSDRRRASGQWLSIFAELGPSVVGDQLWDASNNLHRGCNDIGLNVPVGMENLEAAPGIEPR
jgi:hypothetical protein